MPNAGPSLRAVAGAALCLTAAACAAATPNRVIRDESRSRPAAGALCERMARDFDMNVTGGDLEGGREFSASQVETAFAARGVSYAINLSGSRRSDACANTSSGVVCTVIGPADLEVQSNRGVARYRVSAGDGGVVATRGARLMCREARQP